LQIPTHWTEIFATASGAVYQSNRDRCFWLDFKGELTSFKIPCFSQFKKSVDKIDLQAMALNPDKAFDYEIVMTCSCERCFVLTLAEVVALQEILAGAKVMLELNSIIYERLYSIPI
jgi:hypothetical protein